MFTVTNTKRGAIKERVLGLNKIAFIFPRNNLKVSNLDRFFGFTDVCCPFFAYRVSAVLLTHVDSLFYILFCRQDFAEEVRDEPHPHSGQALPDQVCSCTRRFRPVHA
jgi:hypothetical protein